MAYQSVKIIGGSEAVYDSSNIGIVKCLAQRRDGVLVHYYGANFSVGFNDYAASYSYDLGLTWAQAQLDFDPFSLKYQTLIRSDFAVHHLAVGVPSSHKKSLPCLATSNLSYPSDNYNPRGYFEDEDDNIYMFYTDSTTSQKNLYYTIWNGTSWSTPTLITCDPEASIASVEIAMDSDGFLHIVYQDTDTYIGENTNCLYYQNNISGWGNQVVIKEDTIGSAEYASITCDENDVIHISFALKFYSSGSVTSAGIKYGKYNGSTFSLSTLFNSAFDSDVEATSNRISSDKQNNLFIVFTGNSSGALSDFPLRILTSTNSGISWTADVVAAKSSGSNDLIFLFKPGYNNFSDSKLEVGVAGVYKDSTDTRGLYYFYSDDVSYKYSVLGTPNFCNTTNAYEEDTVNCPYVSDGKVRKLVSTVTGLDHLEGMSVAVVADGIYIGQKTVSNGSITLTTPAAVVHVGLKYRGILIPLNLIVAGQLQNSISFGKNVSSIALVVANTVGVKYGTSLYNLQSIPRQDAGEDSTDPKVPFTGTIALPNDDKWEDDKKIIYVQDEPYPCKLNAMNVTIEVGEK